MKKVIVDCDPGLDDAVAILLAHKLLDVKAITTVAGNTSLANTTRNALSLVELMGADIPVHSGAYQALAGDTQDAHHVHGTTGFGGAELPEPQRDVASEDAVTYLIEQSREIEDLWVIAIGPLTNIAMAIEEYPAIVTRLGGLAVMGGSTEAGNATSTAEFNIWADPEAAKMVFSSGLNPIICGLNLTRQFQSDDDFVASLSNGGHAVSGLVADLYSFMHNRMETLYGERRSALHDPCAVLTLTHPELFEMQNMYVDVETRGEITRGMTVFDQRTTKSKPEPNAQVATSINADAARAVVLKTIIEGYA